MTHNPTNAVPAPADSRFATVDRETVEYRYVPGSNPAAPTLVFLHQGLGSVSAWRDIPDRLAALTGCAAFLYSRRGYGWSEPLHKAREIDYMQEEAERVLPRVLSFFGLSDIVLVGHSDGATIALSYLGLGHRARAAIAIAPHVHDERVTYEAIAAQRAAWWTTSLRTKLQRYHKDADAMFLSWTDIWLMPSFRNWSITQMLLQVRDPVLALQGWQDEVGTMIHIDTVAQLSPGPVERVKLEDCGHDPFRDLPQETLLVCADFLNRHAHLRS